jgi:hypothetical protein
MLLNASVRKVLYLEGYPDDLAKELAEEGRLDIRQMPSPQGRPAEAPA